MHFKTLERADDYRDFRELEEVDEEDSLSLAGEDSLVGVLVELLEDLFISSFELLLPFLEFFGITSSMVELNN